MSDKVFFDSNILIYAYDTRDPNKQNQAQALLVNAAQYQTAVLSTQVLGEFFVVMTRKIPQPMTSAEAAEVIAELGALEVTPLDFPPCSTGDCHAARIRHLVLGFLDHFRRRTGWLCPNPFGRSEQRPGVSRNRSPKSISALRWQIVTCAFRRARGSQW